MIRSYAVAAILSLAVASVSRAAPITNVVFGNLGSSGTNSVGSFSGDISIGGNSLAQGFTAASPKLTVQSVSLWLSGSSSSTTVRIFNSDGGQPGDPVAISGSQTVGAKGLYQFSFSGTELTNGTNYWIVPNGNVSWYLAGSAPTEQNASGYSFTGALERPQFGSWQTAGTNTMSVSINAVPEPSSYALAAIGFGIAGFVRWRRRTARSGR